MAPAQTVGTFGFLLGTQMLSVSTALFLAVMAGVLASSYPLQVLAKHRKEKRQRQKVQVLGDGARRQEATRQPNVELEGEAGHAQRSGPSNGDQGNSTDGPQPALRSPVPQWKRRYDPVHLKQMRGVVLSRMGEEERHAVLQQLYAARGLPVGGPQGERENEQQEHSASPSTFKASTTGSVDTVTDANAAGDAAAASQPAQAALSALGKPQASNHGAGIPEHALPAPVNSRAAALLGGKGDRPPSAGSSRSRSNSSSAGAGKHLPQLRPNSSMGKAIDAPAFVPRGLAAYGLAPPAGAALGAGVPMHPLGLLPVPAGMRGADMLSASMPVALEGTTGTRPGRGTGEVAMYKGSYGFIRPDDGSRDVFFHYTEMRCKLEVGDRVSYFVDWNAQTKKWNAYQVRKERSAMAEDGAGGGTVEEGATGVPRRRARSRRDDDEAVEEGRHARRHARTRSNSFPAFMEVVETE